MTSDASDGRDGVPLFGDVAFEASQGGMWRWSDWKVAVLWMKDARIK